jgi:hypothetical protein
MFSVMFVFLVLKKLIWKICLYYWLCWTALILLVVVENNVKGIKGKTLKVEIRNKYEKK